ncbi:MAG: bifunctional ADP-dependent NAD(P)H-hydrate dehydratase/NAD(P)H-hydrate epimerase [Propionibacteriaceae bacterium]|jgi:hydroxyethylthiazole kinase-like uncharacterized protein yjeF|nr:bifunctional ADP-dependent NAD(P)H-hydrate dehydratase/NAD(P)H-hydrate epimerase [Propionibacteriaceae bacterium]
MYQAYSVAAIRDAETQEMARIGEGVLMRRAACALAQVALRELRRLAGNPYGSWVTILAGSGNNGGDGLFAGVRLLRRGVRVRAWRAGGRVHDAGWAAFLAAGGRELSLAELVAELDQNDLVIDAILGIGGKAGLHGVSADVATAVFNAQVPVIAVDLPSGVPAEPVFFPGRTTFVRPNVTVAFGGRKPAHVLEPAKSVLGRVEVIDIGLPKMEPTLTCWEPSDIAEFWPVPSAASDKYSRGVVGIDAGSAQYPGAGLLAVSGALKAGAGMVRFLGEAEVARRVSQAYPNAVLAAGQVQSWVVGCGWGEQPYGAGKIARIIAAGIPVVIDADGLRYLPTGEMGSLARSGRPGQILLTPHAGELARLLDVKREEVVANPLPYVSQAADRWQAVVLLKGATQLVATPDSPVISVAVPGPAWAAQAGSGDLLAGICGALLAAGLDLRQAALAGASIQALGARQVDAPISPQDLQLPIRELLSGSLG